MQQRIDIDLEALIDKLPLRIQRPVMNRDDVSELLEVVMDLGRQAEARFLTESVLIESDEVTEEDLQYVIERIGSFGEDNRAGIERTLHRIAAIRNRDSRIIGLTLRAGRAVYGSIQIIEDLIFTEKSVLLLGKPGVGKTTMLREVARVLADDAKKRVITVDTSNEIAGDGDIPHPGIGQARRMQVPSPALQHAVMIEAVENHMPEVIIIDEIGTEMDANAARTIAERGVQLVATAHGNTIQNLIMNPTLSDLVGGVQSVTLGDIEARNRRTQKTVLERRAPPTFDILVEIQDWDRVIVHPDVAVAVDRMLRGFAYVPQVRTIDAQGRVECHKAQPRTSLSLLNGRDQSFQETPAVVTQSESSSPRSKQILPYGVNKGKLQQALRSTNASVNLVSQIAHADLVVTTKNYYRRRTQVLVTAEKEGKPVYVLRKNTLPQIEQFIRAIEQKRKGVYSDKIVNTAVKEAEEAVGLIGRGEHEIVLNPQGSYVRHLQHQVAEQYGLTSSSTGREPGRHVVFYGR